MNTLEIDGHAYQYPNKLDQLTREQLIGVYQRITRKGKKNVWADVLKIIFPECPNLRKLTAQIEIDSDLSLQQGALTQTMLERTAEAIVRKGELIKDTLHSFDHHKRTYIGPGNGFAMLTVREYIHAYELSFYYAQNPENNAHLLHQLIYCLYRPQVQDDNPENPQADLRAPFHYALLERRGNAFADLPWHLKAIIYQYFVHCQDALIIQKHENIFSQGGTPTKAAKGTPKPIDWGELITLMTQGDSIRKEATMNERVVEWFFMKNTLIAEAKKDQARRLAHK